MAGLAQTMAAPAASQEQTMAPQGQNMMAQGQQMPTIEEIMALLMQGVDPQELVDAGVPEQLVMEAIAMLEQQMAAQSQPNQGLAAVSAGGMQ
jgi:hypothetical protein